MTESTAETDHEELKTWFTKLLYSVTREMIKIGAVDGAAAEAKPVWVSPYRILIAQVWEASQKSQFIWTISGENAITDHITGSMAETPREAARHFALKWQLDANRLLEVAKNKTGVENAQEHMEGYTDKLIQYAESLYNMVERDDVWKIKPISDSGES